MKRRRRNRLSNVEPVSDEACLLVVCFRRFLIFDIVSRLLDLDQICLRSL